jgi:hypothetical protein
MRHPRTRLPHLFQHPFALTFNKPDRLMRTLLDLVRTLPAILLQRPRLVYNSFHHIEKVFQFDLGAWCGPTKFSWEAFILC